MLAALPLLAAVASFTGLPDVGFTGPGGVAGPILCGAVESVARIWFGSFSGLARNAILLLASGLLSFVALGIPLTTWREVGGQAPRRVASIGRSIGNEVFARAERRRLRAEREKRRRVWRIFVPFRALGSKFGKLVRRSSIPSPQLSALLRAADAAASAPLASRPHSAPRVAMPQNSRSTLGASQPDVDFGQERLPSPRVAAPLPRAGEAARAAQHGHQRTMPPPSSELPIPGFRLPPLSLLAAAPQRRDGGPSEELLQNTARLLESVLEDYGVRGQIVEVRPGPVVTLYELEPAPGTKSARVIGLADDVARSMSVTAVRIATVPGRNVIGIEMPNSRRETVFLSELFADEEWERSQGRLSLALGKDIGGTPVIADLAAMPHLLVAGTTGSGKSVAINTMILSLLYRYQPNECRFIMIDPKMLELSAYDRIPHLLAPVVTESSKAIGALKWTVREMERRYRALSQLGVRNIAGYNKKVASSRERGEVLTRRVQTGFDPDTSRPVFEDLPLALDPLPMIVVVIDEMADLMVVAGKEIEASVQRLAQMARAAGIHVVMATQRPSVDVITGVIKANFPARISFQVSSKIDSRTILGEQGAEQLLGQGDMLFMPGVGRVSRVHGPFVSDAEVEAVVEYLREQGEPAYIEEVTEIDEDADGQTGTPGGGSDGERGLYEQAVSLVSREGKASTSFVQRHLSIGYNRAAKLIEQMEKEGVVGPANHVGKREVLTGRAED